MQKNTSKKLSLAAPNCGRSIINNRKMFYNNCRQKCKCITSRSSILLRCLTASQMVRTKFKKQFYMNKFELVMLGQNNEIIKTNKFFLPPPPKKILAMPPKGLTLINLIFCESESVDRMPRFCPSGVFGRDPESGVNFDALRVHLTQNTFSYCSYTIMR